MDPPAPVHARWEHFAHAADVGVRGVGATLQEAFEQAALALTGVLVDPRLVRRLTTIDISCEAPDDELLLVDWLNALVYEMATRRMLFAGFDVHVENSQLTARVQGEPVDRRRHQPAVEVKGACRLRVPKLAPGSRSASSTCDVED
jgi:SHS2 domain-containing protein